MVWCDCERENDTSVVEDVLKVFQEWQGEAPTSWPGKYIPPAP